MEDMSVIEVPAGTDYRRDAEKNFWTNLQWQTLFCLLESQTTEPLSRLAALSGLENGEALRAVECMELLGFVKRTGHGVTQIDESFVRLPYSKSDRVRIAEQYVHSSNQVANRILETAETGEHLTKCLTYNSNRELVTELYANIQNAINDFKKKSDAAKGAWDGVYNLSASLVKMSGEV
jgi:hypothetical protein